MDEYCFDRFTYLAKTREPFSKNLANKNVLKNYRSDNQRLIPSAPKPLAGGALPQIPLGELTALLS